MSCLVTATTLLLSIPTSISLCLPYNQSLTTTFFTPFLSHDFSPPSKYQWFSSYLHHAEGDKLKKKVYCAKAMGSLHVKAIFLLQTIAITPSTA
jgi:hypothetical protein